MTMIIKTNNENDDKDNYNYKKVVFINYQD